MSIGDVPLVPKAPARLVATWGVLGVVLLLLQAVVKLGIVAAAPFVSGSGLTPLESAVCASWVLFSVYAEGYRGFQKSFVPRTVARAFHLSSDPRPFSVLLAPLFAMALIRARPRRLLVSWTLVAFIVLAVIFIRRLPAPWRSIVDMGVVAGLAWGTASLITSFVRALRGDVPRFPLDLPE
jgi:hypothetical protein